MTQIRKVKDVYPGLRSAVQAATGARVVPVLPEDPTSEPTVHMYVAGGYRVSQVVHRVVLQVHCWAADGPAAMDLAATAAGVVTSPAFGDWWGGSIVTGPYDNPSPAYPSGHRFSLQLECNVGTQVVNF